jgi:hypothetical protein
MIPWRAWPWPWPAPRERDKQRRFSCAEDQQIARTDGCTTGRCRDGRVLVVAGLTDAPFRKAVEKTHHLVVPVVGESGDERL